MKENYNMDLTEFVRREYTPSEFAKTLPFYATSFSHFRARRNYYTERAGLDSYLIIFTLSGKGLLRYAGQEFALEKGSAAFIDCRNYQYYATAGKDDWEFCWIHIRGASVPLYYGAAFRERFSIVQDLDFYLVQDTFEKMFRLRMTYSMSYELELTGCISTLLTHIVQSALEREEGRSGALYSQAVAYLKQHYRETVRVDDLARLMNFSRYHFIRVFKSETGETPYEFITRYRVNQSKKLLRTTDLPLEEISHLTGFNDVNTYIKAFKRMTDTTPGSYRKE